MRQTRLYLNPTIYDSIETGTAIILAQEQHHYLSNVLKAKKDQTIYFITGDGCEYTACITEISRKSTTILVEHKILKNVESPLHLHLGQALAKGEKMDFILQKAVELGVNEITPFHSQFSNVKLDPTRLEKKHEHWQKVMIAACLQSGRNTLPTLHPICTFEQWVEKQKTTSMLILSPSCTEKLSGLIKPEQAELAQNTFSITIGPEGGFSAEELGLAKANNAHLIKLGPRILRTETAALSVISCLQLQFGDF